tara:strand:- start:100 stop:456 length:357 start_codon:yes stop_codon:yes gene_type:complete
MTEQDRRKALWVQVGVYVAAVAGVLLSPYIVSMVDSGVEVGFRMPTALDVALAIAMMFIAPAFLWMFFERKGDKVGKLKNWRTRLALAFGLGLASHTVVGAFLNLVRGEAGKITELVG